MSKKVISVELRHVRHWPAKDNRPDMHIVKEMIHYEDGTSKPNLRFIKDFQRPFWITKPIYRDHKDKKEFEDIRRCSEYTSTQSNLANNIASRLGMTGYRKNKMWDVKDSPYLYGADVSSETFIKKMYLDKWGDSISTPYSYVGLDVESDIDTDQVTVITIVLEKMVRTYVSKKLVNNVIGDVKQRVLEKIRSRAPSDVVDIKDYDIEVTLHDDAASCIVEAFKQLHEWKPDIMAAWNAGFDMGIMTRNLESAGIEPKDVYSDPSIPEEIREYIFKEGQSVLMTESGVRKNRDPHEIWHVFKSMSSFYILDAMATYGYVRVGSAKVFGGYGIDNISKVEKVGSKLHLVDTRLIPNTIAWHKFMSKEHPISYICYNIWDVILMKALDNVTNDISLNLGLLSGLSSFDIFNSGPKRIVDSIFFYAKEELGLVLGTAPKKQDGDKVLGLEEWINKNN